MQYLFYILLGLLPSLIWLSFYLKKDKLPESNSIVLRIFIWGMFLAPLAIILELILIWLLNPGSNPLDLLSQTYQASFIKIILAATLIPALVEEYLKYSIIRHRFLRKPEFDEPVDAMLYCIIAGLGFAAVENLLILFKISFPVNLGVGSYSIQTALVDRDTHLTANYEWVDLALVFNVINIDKTHFAGCLWNEPSISIEEISL